MWLLLACTAPDPEGVDSAVDSVPRPRVDATLQLHNAKNGKAKDGVALEGELGTATTDDEGQGTVEVFGASAFQIGATEDSLMPHLFHGRAGEDAFTLISYVATESLTDQVYELLGIARDPEMGIVVVGLDRPSLAPAVGSGAELNVDYEAAFVLGSQLPEEGTTLVQGGNSIVTFANVPVGQARVTAVPAEGEACLVFPALVGVDHGVEVRANTVSVVVFTCE